MIREVTEPRYFIQAIHYRAWRGDIGHSLCKIICQEAYPDSPVLIFFNNSNEAIPEMLGIIVFNSAIVGLRCFYLFFPSLGWVGIGGIGKGVGRLVFVLLH